MASTETMIHLSPSLSRRFYKDRNGKHFKVRDVYHMFRDYNPLYRVRTGLNLTAKEIDELSLHEWQRNLRSPQTNLYEGLDWSQKTTDRVRLGGPALDGVLHYVGVLDLWQDQLSIGGKPVGADSRISIEVMMGIYLCWYLARDEVTTDSLYAKSADDLIDRDIVTEILSHFRHHLKKKLQMLMPEHTELAENCFLPDDDTRLRNNE